MPTQGYQTKCFVSFSNENTQEATKIVKFLEGDGLQVATNQDTYVAGLSIREKLQSTIEKSDFVVFIVPNNSDAQKYWLYEIGIIVGIGKPLLALVDKSVKTQLPSDLSSIMYLTYDPQNVEASFGTIRKWALYYLQSSI